MNIYIYVYIYIIHEIYYGIFILRDILIYYGIYHWDINDGIHEWILWGYCGAWGYLVI